MDGNGRGRATQPVNVNPPPPADEDFLDSDDSATDDPPLTETGNAERFVAEHRQDVRLVVEWGEWRVWDNQRWREDKGQLLLQQKVKETHRRLYELAARCADPKRRKEIAGWAKASERRAVREATAKLARSEAGVAVSHHQLDGNPMVLNVANGTLDLGTGKLRQHQREDLATRIMPVSFHENATCPRWESFLAEILPDAATVEYLQRAIGYSLTSLVREHCLFVLWGAGANGKSTLLLVLLELLGPYATQAPADLLLARRGEKHPTEVTVLHGRRMVVAQETDNNRRWAEATVKQLTGGDRLIARRMREDFWEFMPTHKLWMATNHRPSVRGTDEGIWRRIKLIPFERVIPPENRDASLLDRLRAELPGILRWAVEGAIAWQRDGLGEPATVTGAVAAYRAEEDRLAPFVDERCVLTEGARVSRRALRQAYDSWAETNADGRPLGAKEFTEQVRQLARVSEGNVKVAGTSLKGWHGIGLRAQQEEGG